METFATAQHQLRGSQVVGMAVHGNDSGLYVEFESVAVQHPFKSQEAGRPIFEDVDFITIFFPGDNTKKVVRPVKKDDDESGPSDCKRFPVQWAAYQQKTAQVHEGMPVTEWPPLTKAQAQEFKAMNIHTVEQLADLPDSALTWLGARQTRDQAKVWVERSKGSAVDSKLLAENASLKARISALEEQMRDISAKRIQKG